MERAPVCRPVFLGLVADFPVPLLTPFPMEFWVGSPFPELLAVGLSLCKALAVREACNVEDNDCSALKNRSGDARGLPGGNEPA